jgi:hypothetical protein
MYVEAICPLCFATHILPEDLRGEEYRCEHCEELFIVNRKSKRTSKRPPRPPQVKPADEPDGEVLAVEPVEMLPEAKRAPQAPPKKVAADDDEVLEIPDDALQPERRVVKTAPTPKRRAEKDEDRPRKRRFDDEEEDDERPRRRPAPSSGVPVALVVGFSAGAVFLLGLIAVGAWWLFSGRDPDKPQPQAQAQPPARNDFQGAMKGPVPPQEAPPPKQEPPPAAPPPKQEPPPAAPPRAEPPAVWNVKADPPAAAVKLPADFKKEIKAPGPMPQIVFPKQSSPFVAIGSNLRVDDERQVWSLQSGQMTGKVVGSVRTINGVPPVLSPDGAYLAYPEQPTTVAVWAPGPGKKVSVEVGDGFLSDYTDFAGDKLLTLRRVNNALTFQTWDPTTGQHVFSFTPPGRLAIPRHDALAVSPGGGYLALAARETLWVYDVNTGAVAGERPLPKWEPGRAYTCHGLSFSPDGRELAGVFFTAAALPHMVCWDAATGDVVSDTTFPQALPAAGVQSVYRGHVIDWVGDRRGWLLFGYTLVDRTKDGSATFLPTPPAVGSPVPRHMIGPAHVATLTPGGRAGEKVLTVTPFDPDKPN